MLKRRIAGVLAALLLALGIWGAAAYQPALERARSEQVAPAPQPVADPGGGGSGHGG